jgi:hypothetical protein
MPSGDDPLYERETASVGVRAHRSDFIRHSRALGMNMSMPHPA